MRYSIYITQGLLAALVGGFPLTTPDHSTDIVSLTRRDGLSPFDLSGVKRLVAIGDSYSAGIGAGERLATINPATWGSEWWCSRWDKAFPYQINQRLGEGNGRHFQFHSCSGATVQQTIDEQIKEIEGNEDAILISAGGNDAELVHVLNACVYQFLSPQELVIEALLDTMRESGYDSVDKFEEWLEKIVDKIKRSCATQLEESKKLLNDKKFQERIEDLIVKSKAKLNKDGAIYYTGYAKFWDERMEDSDWCSKPEHTWSVLLSKIEAVTVLPMLHKATTLSVALRKSMNDLVDLANTKIDEVVRKVNNNEDRVIFINYDDYIRDTGGRFCAPGTEEPSPERRNLAFFELTAKDLLGKGQLGQRALAERDEKAGGVAQMDTFEGDIAWLSKIALSLGGKYGDENIEQPEDALQKRKSFNPLPDGWGRIFHPSVLGQTIIADVVMHEMRMRNGRKLKADIGKLLAGEHLDNCPLKEPDLDTEDGPPALCTGADSKSSGLPTKVFYWQDKGVFDEFCDQMENKLDKKNNQIWTVNAKGEHQTRKRSPPPNPNIHKQDITLRWVPDKNSNQCKTSCKKAYYTIAQSPCGAQGGKMDIMAVAGSADTGCGTYSYEITGDGVPKPDAGRCLTRTLDAPQRDNEAGKNSLSVTAAVEKWCNEMDGKTVVAKPGVDTISQRFPVTSFDIEERHSFWLRATFIPGCKGEIPIKKEECKRLLGAMKFCDPDSVSTHGVEFDASECMEYAIDVSGSVDDDSPPWNEKPARFPPPENAKGYNGEVNKVNCFQDPKNSGGQSWPGVTLGGDLDESIINYCNDGKGLYRQTRPTTYWRAYDDENYCKDGNGWDHKKHPLDCMYALRKMVHLCKKDGNKGAWFTYRCSQWKLIWE